MPITAGTRLGSYEVVSPLGAGGMGEVYLARDTRLDRDVAIKVLPPHLAATADARARFEREARAVSSLNHPNICTLYDVGREGDTDYLVMERIEGETLATRLTRGPLPVEEALRVGTQIADALDRAHRGGLVHRDLKPGNVMLTKTGAKLLDFGLARPALPDSSSGSHSMAPTLTQPLTAEGSIVGTFQYMAPEQLEGKEADARSDLWALGAVLYEAVTARRAFEGGSQASLIAAILERQPRSITETSPLVPPALTRLIGACLAKDPDDRIQTAHDVKLQLQWIAEGGSLAGVPAPVAARRRSRESLAWVLAAAGVAGTVIFAALFLLRPAPSRDVVRFEMRTPSGQSQMTWPRISPDGQTLAFLARDSSGTTRIWLRPLDAFEAQPLAGTEGAGRPFWSPDGRHLAYVADGKLKKVPAAGGPTVLISDVPGRADGSWGKDVILLDAGQGDSLLAVPASGGVARPASSFDRSVGETQHAWPYFLPDGEHFLFVVTRSDPSDRRSHIKLGKLGSLEAFEIGVADSRAEFAPPNRALYVIDGTLVAHALDLGKHRFIGDPVPITDRVSVSTEGLFSVSPGGVLAFGTGAEGGLSELEWVDRSGHALGQAAAPNRYREVMLSPDGRRAATNILDTRTNNHDVWVLDLERNIASRLTFGAGNEIWPVWSHDGRRIYFASDRNGPYGVYSKAASGVGEEDSLEVFANENEGPSDCSDDGRWIASAISRTSTSWDILIRPTTAGGKPEAFLATPASERDGTFSPDGRWLAYRSSETGRHEIYVRSFPDGQSKWQVSNGGGDDPVWTKGGREIVYLRPDGMLMAVPVTAGEEFHSAVPVELFRATLESSGFVERRWDVTKDGERFLLNVPAGNRAGLIFDVTKNWLTQLETH